jgi:acyl-CoA synthetase (AMP-forming)/AMP-acid ligase II
MIGIDLPGLIASKRFMRLERRPAGALIVLTSGTTSIAKGVRRRLTLVQLAGVVHSLTVRLKLHCHERTLITVPLFHGYGIAAVALAMGLGSPMGLTCHTDGRRMRGRAIEFGARTIVTVPTLLRRILDASSIGTLDSLQRIISGSAPLPSKVVQDMVEQLGPVLYNLYGSTEAGLISIASPADLSETSTTVGFPVRGTGITIRGNAEEALPWGQSGEVVVSSRLVFDGYTHDSVPIGFTMGFGTGDRGVIDEAGRLRLLGRIDEILIIGGENIHPQQVEHRLLMLPQVIDAAVTGVDDDSGILQMAAWLVLLPGSQIEQSDFAAVLPAYMRPSRWQLVDQLPRNAIGKLERYHLPKSIGRGGDVRVHCR